MDVWNKCRKWQEEGIDSVVATVIKSSAGSPGKSGFKMAIGLDGRKCGTVGGGAVELKVEESSRELFETKDNRIIELDLGSIGMTCGGKISLFLEYVPAEKRFFVFGAGHLGKALTPLLESIGYSVTLFDDRPENSSFEDASRRRKVIIGDYTDISSIENELKSSGLVFVATHGHRYDLVLLKQLFALTKDYEYLGLIGSRTKIAASLKKAESEGLAPPDNFFAPVGLAIGGDTAAEIAMSIAAEILAVRNGKQAVHMRD